LLTRHKKGVLKATRRETMNIRSSAQPKGEEINRESPGVELLTGAQTKDKKNRKNGSSNKSRGGGGFTLGGRGIFQRKSRVSGMRKKEKVLMIKIEWERPPCRGGA